MRKTNKDKISQVFLEQGNSEDCLDEVKFSDVLADFIVSKEIKKQIQDQGKNYILWDRVYEVSEIRVNEHG